MDCSYTYVLKRLTVSYYKTLMKDVQEIESI